MFGLFLLTKMADTVLAAVHLSDLPFGTMLHLMGVLQLFLFNKQVKTLKKKSRIRGRAERRGCAMRRNNRFVTLEYLNDTPVIDERPVTECRYYQSKRNFSERIASHDK